MVIKGIAWRVLYCLANSKLGKDFLNILYCYAMQIKVGQAIYLAGSMFNHSCGPNAHAYFLSRTLYIRTTDSVSAGSELELSYGPQVPGFSR